MRKALIAFALVLPLAAQAEPSSDKEYPPCDFAATAKGPFSSARPTDVITVTVRGRPCWEGRFQITVRDQEGRVLYIYDEPFKRHTPVPWDDDEGILEAAQGLVDSTVADAFSRTSASLPPYSPAAELYAEGFASIAIPAEQYKAIRAKNVPALFHATHYEAWQWVVYDPESKRAVVVVEGGF